MTRVVAGLFDKHRTADLVVEHLVQEFGVSRERIQVHAADPTSGEEARSPQDEDQEAGLADLGLPEAAAQAYDEGMRRGSILLVAWVTDHHVDRVLAAYREYGATDADAHEVRDPREPGASEQATRVRAYYLWEQEGRPEGRDLEFWHRARAAEGVAGGAAARAPQEFAGETGAAPLPEHEASSDT